jgi:hypothetical protein
MLGNYRVASQLIASGVMLSSIELVTFNVYLFCNIRLSYIAYCQSLRRLVSVHTVEPIWTAFFIKVELEYFIKLYFGPR